MNLVKFIIGLHLLTCGLSFSQNVNNDTCGFKVIVRDPDPNGTNIRNKPKGDIIDKIYPNKDEFGYLLVTVIGSKSNWLKCKYADDKVGWIYGGLVTLWTRNYGADPLKLYKSPDLNSKVLHTIKGEQEVNVFGCNCNWAYVKVVIENKSYSGWLSPDMQCANPLSNCCYNINNSEMNIRYDIWIE